MRLCGRVGLLSSIMEENKDIAHFREADEVEQTVAEHLRETAELAKEHAKKIGLPLMGELCGLLHDVGKYSDDFQKYIQSAVGLIKPGDEGFVDPKKKKGKIDHATAGAQLMWRSGSQEQFIEIFFIIITLKAISGFNIGE